jgi:hypothetical protein
MSLPSSPPLNLDVRSRRTETRLAIGCLVLAGLGPWLLPGSALVLACLSALLGSCVYVGLHKAGWLATAQRVARLAWLSDGRWMISDDAGRSVECELHPSTRVSAHAVWLCLRSSEAPHRRFSLLLSRVDHAGGDLRRLMVRLQLDGAKSLASGRAAVALWPH